MFTYKKQFGVPLAVILLFLVSFQPTFANFGHDILWNLVVSFIGMFTGFAGMLLNAAIQELVIGFGNQFLTSGVGVAVDNIWVVIRDIFNLTFIFALVFLGFKMILDSADAGTRRWLVSIILAALLVNFSLYITKFIVDVSNITATEIAQTFVSTNDDGQLEVMVSQRYMDILGLAGIFQGDWNKLSEDKANMGYILGTAVFLIVAMFAFAAGGIMLIIRYAMLCLFMVFSPLMFLGWVFPSLMSHSKKYWSGFLGRAFYAPISLLLLYLSFTILVNYQQAARLGGGDINMGQMLSKADGDAVIPGFQGTIFYFVIASIFLIAASIIANHLGVEGGKGAVNIMNNTKRNLQNRVNRSVVRTRQAAVGTGKWAVANTAGRGARAASYALGRGLERGLARWEKERRPIALSPSANKKMRAGIGKLQNAKFGMTFDKGTERKEQGIIDKRVKTGVELDEKRAEREKLDKKIKAMDKQLKNDKGLTDEQRNTIIEERTEANTKIEELESAIASLVTRLSTEQIKGLTLDELKSTEIAVHLSDSQIKALEDSGHLTNDEVNVVKAKRNDNIVSQQAKVLNDEYATTTQVEQANLKLATTTSRISNERLSEFSGAQFNDLVKNAAFLTNLSEKQMEVFQNSGKFSAQQIVDLKQARMDGFKTIALQGSLSKSTNLGNREGASDAERENYERFVASGRENLMRFKGDQLSADVFTLKDEAGKPVMLPYVTSTALESNLRNPNAGMSNSNIEKLKNEIIKYLNDREMDLKERQRLAKQLEKWAKSNSTYAAQFGYDTTGIKSDDLPRNASDLADGGGKIDLGTNVNAAVRDRDKQQKT